MKIYLEASVFFSIVHCYNSCGAGFSIWSWTYSILCKWSTSVTPPCTRKQTPSKFCPNKWPFCSGLRKADPNYSTMLNKDISRDKAILRTVAYFQNNSEQDFVIFYHAKLITWVLEEDNFLEKAYNSELSS